MTKNDLVEFIAEKANLTKADASRALEATLAGIEAGLKKEGKVSLIGFGTFAAKKRAARSGINPLTGKQLNVPEKMAATFKAGSKLKEALN